MNNSNNFCLVCGYDLGVPISTAVAHDIICPSCGIQYGYSDRVGDSIEKRERLYTLWREAWNENGNKPLVKEKAKEVIAKAINNL